MVKSERISIRRATDTDELSVLLGDIGKHRLNPASILVAESSRGIEGMCVLFDGGHSVVYVDHLILLHDAPKETGPLLILDLNHDCQLQEKTAIFLVTNSVELAYIGKRRGAQVEGPLFRIRYDVTELNGAQHA